MLAVCCCSLACLFLFVRPCVLLLFGCVYFFRLAVCIVVGRLCVFLLVGLVKLLLFGCVYYFCLAVSNCYFFAVHIFDGWPVYCC